MPRNALGKGLSALIREPDPNLDRQTPPPLEQPPAVPAAPSGAAAAAKPAPSEIYSNVDIDLIEPSPYQPRTRFREDSLDELARSIRASGILQPLVLRRINSRFQLVAGERRWRAAQRAGLRRVPALIRDIPEEVALEMALIENLQREDLNPLEQARAFERLCEEFRLTQEQVAERTGKDRATIANSLRLLRLDQPIQELIEEGRISPGHARPLLSIANSEDRIGLAKKIARGGMTVRQVERIAAGGSRPRPTPSISHQDPNTKEALEQLQRTYGTRVLLQLPHRGRPGQLIFEYYTDSDLTRLYDQLMNK
jgi:ParB family transcriptional regulator, chromosome partitioning protein